MGWRWVWWWCSRWVRVAMMMIGIMVA